MRGTLWVIRHGETERTLSGAFTGSADIPLTDAGRRQALALKDHLAGRNFTMVLTSPLSRARETCCLAGYSAQAQIEPNLAEWRHGDYEGRTLFDIRKEAPGWSLWSSDTPNGENIGQVASRAECVIDRAHRADGDVALFAHAHVLRVLAACWLGLPAECDRLLTLDTAAIGVLGYESDARVITRWNTGGESR